MDNIKRLYLYGCAPIAFCVFVVVGMSIYSCSKHNSDTTAKDTTQTVRAEEEQTIPASLPCVLYRDKEKVYHANTTCKNIAGKAVTPRNIEGITMLNPKFCTECLNQYQIQSFFDNDKVQYEINP